MLRLTVISLLVMQSACMQSGTDSKQSLKGNPPSPPGSIENDSFKQLAVTAIQAHELAIMVLGARQGPSLADAVTVTAPDLVCTRSADSQGCSVKIKDFAPGSPTIEIKISEPGEVANWINWLNHNAVFNATVLESWKIFEVKNIRCQGRLQRNQSRELFFNDCSFKYRISQST